MTPFEYHTPVDPRLSEARRAIFCANLNAELVSPWQLKIGRFNYYWTTGKITIDSGPIVQDKGASEFIALVKADRLRAAQLDVATTIENLSLVFAEDAAGPTVGDLTKIDPPF